MLVYQDSYQVFVIKHQFHIKLCCTTQRWKIYWLMGMTRWGHESLNSPSKFFPKFMRVFPVKLYTESFDRFFFQNLMTHIFQNEYFSALQYISLHRPPKYNEQLNLSLSDLQSTECNGTKRVWGTYPVHGFILTTQYHYHKCLMYRIRCQNILGTHPVPQECVGPFEESSAPASLPHYTNLETQLFILLQLSSLRVTNARKICREFRLETVIWLVDCTSVLIVSSAPCSYFTSSGSWLSQNVPSSKATL